MLNKQFLSIAHTGGSCKSTKDICKTTQFRELKQSDGFAKLQKKKGG
jgi:hypothetical protein